MRRYSIHHCIAPAFLLFSSGCVISVEDPPEKLQFSPDGKLLVHFTFTWSALWGTPVESDEMASISWRKVDKPQVVRSASIERIAPGRQQRPPSEKVHAVIAPDSAHVAVISPNYLTVVDLRTGQSSRVTPHGERVTSVAWLNASEVVYAAHTQPRGKEPKSWTRTIYRQRIDQPWKKRIEVYREFDVVTGADDFIRWGLESWSPDGRWVIFASPYFDGLFDLLDVETGRRRPLSKADGLSNSVAWRSDSSAALCVGGSWPMEAVLVPTDGGPIVDLSDRFAETFGDYPPILEPLWTADNEYVAALDYRLRGCLVRPDPWEVLHVAEWVKANDDPRRPRRLGQVRLVPVPGYVLVANEEADFEVVNYCRREAYHVEAIAAFWLTDDWAWSPDGMHLARNREPSREILWYSGADVLPGWKKPVIATTRPGEEE
jgi:hypothetical protein